MAAKHDTNSKEVCHLSWFMMEVDEDLPEEGKKKTHILNESIHFMNFIDHNPINRYVDRKVKFDYNKDIKEGRVVMAADKKCDLDELIQQIKNDREVDHSLSKQYLVLYENGTKSFTVVIVNHRQIEWRNGVVQSYENYVSQGLLIHGDNTLRPAHVLFANKSDEVIQDRFNFLKDKVIDNTWKKSLDNVGNAQNCWLLLQFSKGLYKVTYSIVNESDIISLPGNLYPNVVAYLMEKDIAVQAVILRKSLDWNELDEELRCVKELYTNCSFQDFPV